MDLSVHANDPIALQFAAKNCFLERKKKHRMKSIAPSLASDAVNLRIISRCGLGLGATRDASCVCESASLAVAGRTEILLPGGVVIARSSSPGVWLQSYAKNGVLSCPGDLVAPEEWSSAKNRSPPPPTQQ